MIKGKESVRELQSELSKIYGEVNGRLSAPEILNRLDENAGYLAKNTIEERDVSKWLSTSLAWLFALANKIEIDVQDAILRKYPGYCHYCLESHCICEMTFKSPRAKVDRDEELRGKYLTLFNYLTNQRVSADLDFFSTTLAGMYPANVTRWRLNRYEILAKLAEERAEIIEAYRRWVAGPSEPAKQAIQEEIADYFCWLIVIWYLSYRAKEGYSIQEAFCSQFRLGCPYCNAMICRCEPTLQMGVRSDSQLSASNTYEPDSIRKLQAEVAKLVQLMQTRPEITPDIPKKLEDIKPESSKKEISATLAEVQKSLGAIEKSTDSVRNMATMVQKLFEWVATYWPS